MHNEGRKSFVFWAHTAEAVKESERCVHLAHISFDELLKNGKFSAFHVEQQRQHKNIK